jgi:hypothetical protein
VIVIGVFGTLLLNLNLPALAKYPSLIVLAYVGSNLIVSLYHYARKSVRSSRGKPVSQAVGSGQASRRPD